MKVNKFKIESWDDLDKNTYIAGIDPISEESTVHYQQFGLRELEEFLEALANNKTDDGRDI